MAIGGAPKFLEILDVVARRSGVDGAEILALGVRWHADDVNAARRRLIWITRTHRPDLSWAWMRERLGRKNHGPFVRQLGMARRLMLASRDEHQLMGEILAELRLPPLPPFEEAGGRALRYRRVVSEIADLEARLESLRAQRAQLQARV